MKVIKLSGFLVAVVTTLAILSLFVYSSIDPAGSILNLMDKKWVDFIIQKRDVQPHSSKLVIAAVDTKSIDKYGRWPWSRTRMAELVSALNDYYEVHTIGLDIVFSEPEKEGGFPGNLEGDRQFAEAINKKNSVILSYFFFKS